MRKFVADVYFVLRAFGIDTTLLPGSKHMTVIVYGYLSSPKALSIPPSVKW